MTRWVLPFFLLPASWLLPACSTSGGEPPLPSPASDADSGTVLPIDAATSEQTVRPLVRIHYPAGTHRISIRGSGGTLNWSKGASAKSGPDDTWELELPALTQPIEFKPLLDDTLWSRGPNYKLNAAGVVDVYPHFTTLKGSYDRHWPAFTSQVLASTRGLWIYLPPTYIENTRAKFPVVYMHDGQNLFEPGHALSGQEWKVDETIDAAAEDGSIREAIVVGIECTADRDNEYTPPPKGKGAAYLQMVRTEIKPMVDAQFRTLPDRASTVLAGSSLGGLISAYAGVHDSDLFGVVGVMSPSTWWNNLQIIKEVGSVAGKSSRADKVYLDSGDSDAQDGYSDTAALAQKYKAVGYAEGKTLHYVVQPGALHSESYWAQRLPEGLAFLLGPGR